MSWSTMLALAPARMLSRYVPLQSSMAGFNPRKLSVAYSSKSTCSMYAMMPAPVHRQPELLHPFLDSLTCSRSSPERLPKRMCWAQMDVKEHQALFDTNYFGVVCSLPLPLLSPVCLLMAHTEGQSPEQRPRQHNLLLI